MAFLAEREPAVCIRFDEFVLDGENRLLLRAGQPVAIDPKAFDCLELLVRRPGQLTTTARLRRALWPGVHVGPGALRKLINAVRRALGERGHAPALIRTRRGLGYVFAGIVESTAATAGVETSPKRWPFIGRERELALPLALLSNESLSQGGFYFVSGEAGAGKSTLIAELRRRAPPHRARWLIGQCHAGDGVPAFWPWRELGAQLGKIEPLRPVVSRYLARDPSLLGVIPELAARDARAIRVPDPSTERRFDQCRSFAELIARVAAMCPLLITLEDVHWADDGSVLLLELVARAAREHPIVVLASYRPEDVPHGRALSSMIARSAGREHFNSIHLRAFTRAELQALLRAVGHPGATSGSAEILERLTGGNALLVQQLVSQTLAADARLSAGVPLSLPHIVSQRVGALPGATRRVLTYAAVLGHEFSLSVLRVLVRASEARSYAALEPAIRAGILTVSDRGPELLRFEHALLCDALYASLSMQKRQALHSAALRAWAATPETDARNAALAAHAFAANGRVPTARRRALCERAGREAFNALAFDRAALHLGRAVRLLDPADRSRAAAELTLLWAQACWEADDASDAVELAFMQAAARAREAGDAPLFARAAIGYALGHDESITSVRGAATRPQALVLLEEALSRLSEDETELRYRLAQTLCLALSTAGARAQSIEMARLALAHAPTNPSPIRRTLLLLLRRTADPEHADQLATEIAAQGIDPRLSPRERAETHLIILSCYFDAGELVQYERGIELLEGVLAALPQPLRYGRIGERMTAYLATPILARIALATARGQFDEATKRFEAAAQTAEQLGMTTPRDGADYTFLMLLQLLGYRARSCWLEPALEQYTRVFPAPAWHASLARAQFALERGAKEQAGRHFELLRRTGFCPTEGDRSFPLKAETLVRLADVSAALGRAEDAPRLYEALLPYAPQYVTEGGLVHLGSAGRPLGELAMLVGARDRAESHFRYALARNQQMGHAPECVRTELGLASLLCATGRVSEARRLLASTRAAASRMAMSPALAVAEALNRQMAD